MALPQRNQREPASSGEEEPIGSVELVAPAVQQPEPVVQPSAPVSRHPFWKLDRELEKLLRESARARNNSAKPDFMMKDLTDDLDMGWRGVPVPDNIAEFRLLPSSVRDSDSSDDYGRRIGFVTHRRRPPGDTVDEAAMFAQEHVVPDVNDVVAIASDEDSEDSIELEFMSDNSDD